MSDKVLIISGYKIESMHIAGLINRWGMEAEVCDNVEDALKCIKQQDYALVFADAQIKDADKILTADKFSAPVVMIGECDENLSIKKPVSPKRLKACIEFLLDRDVMSDNNSRIDDEFSPESENVNDDLNGSLIKGIDVGIGIANCGSKEGLNEALEIFYNTLDNKADEIERLYNGRDIKNYTIKVHALKSAAKLVGAIEVSDLAKELEDAGNSGNIEFIEEKNGVLLEKYRELKQSLKSLFDDENEKKDDDQNVDNKDNYMNEEEYKETLMAIAEFAGVNDYDSVEMMLDTFSDYKLSKDNLKRVKDIKAFLIEMKWEEIIKLCEI